MAAATATKKRKNLRRGYDGGKLKSEDTKKKFQLKLQNRFELLDPGLGEEEREVNEDWSTIKAIYIDTCEDVLGKVERNKKNGSRTILGGRLKKEGN